MRKRQVNYLRHRMSTKQALGFILDRWREDRKTPIVLITQAGYARKFANQIRVTLARERGKIKKDDRPHYGFTMSDPYPYTDGKVKGEAILIRYRKTNYQMLRETFLKPLAREMNHAD